MRNVEQSSQDHLSRWWLTYTIVTGTLIGAFVIVGLLAGEASAQRSGPSSLPALVGATQPALSATSSPTEVAGQTAEGVRALQHRQYALGSLLLVGPLAWFVRNRLSRRFPRLKGHGAGAILAALTVAAAQGVASLKAGLHLDWVELVYTGVLALLVLWPADTNVKSESAPAPSAGTAAGPGGAVAWLLVGIFALGSSGCCVFRGDCRDKAGQTATAILDCAKAGVEADLPKVLPTVLNILKGGTGDWNAIVAALGGLEGLVTDGILVITCAVDAAMNIARQGPTSQPAVEIGAVAPRPRASPGEAQRIVDNALRYLRQTGRSVNRPARLGP